MDIITRAEARARGLTRYFTGQACPHGHVAERYVEGPCVECSRSRAAERKRKRKARAAAKEAASKAMYGDAFVSRKEAKAKGLKRYFNGVPCKDGHVAERLTNCATCVVCHRRHCEKDRAKNGERHKQYQAAYYANPENKTRHKHWMAEYYKENCDAYAERTAKWRAANPERNRELTRLWRTNNHEKYLRLRAQWRDENREELNAQEAERRKRNPEAFKKARAKYNKTAKGRAKDRAYRKLRDARKLKAMPPWLTEEHHQQIKDIYEQAVLAERLTNVKHHVDHIEPLKGKDCCGLHVPWNLQILTASENATKGNRPVRHFHWKKL